MRKQKVYSFINISGLALSIACCLIILMHIRFESSYDNYHRDADRVYRIGIDIDTPSFKRTFAPISYFMAPYLKENYPQVEEVTRFRRFSSVLVQKGERVFYEDNFIQADNEIFDVLTIPFIKGNPDTALIQAGTLVISESMADKYFGKQEPIGQTIRINSEEYVITGIISGPPKNTHLKFRLIGSMLPSEVPEWARNHWNTNGFFTYVKFRPGTDIKNLLPQIEAGANKNRNTSKGQKFTCFLQPVKDIHLFSHIYGELDPPGNPTYLLIFGVIAGFILFIASINFINLSTARAAARAKEVGMRKIVGAFRSQLIFQFLGESLLTTLLAVVLACVLVIVFLPFYRGLTDISYTFRTEFSFWFLLIPSFLTLGLAALMVSYHTGKAATANPADSLRYE
jgi:putative ABC transport system permease protein